MTLAADAQLLVIVGAVVGAGHGIAGAVSLRSRIAALCQGADPFAIVLSTVVATVVVCAGTDLRYAWRQARRAIDRHGLVYLIKLGAFRLLRLLPSVQAKIAREGAKTTKTIQDELLKETRSCKKTTELPAKGLSQEAVLAQLTEWSAKEHRRWDQGQASGAVYHGEEAFSQFLCQASSKFAVANPLHPDLFPFVRKMEAEVVAMTVSLYNGGPGACGTLSSGGTESILLACKAYRDRARALRNVRHPEIIAPITIHAAFEKAAAYFDMTLVHVPIDPQTMQCDINAVRAAITSDTVLIAGSAPSFPHGAIDPIVELAALAQRHGIGFHTDCCLGSYLMPFLSAMGRKVPRFDFSVPGVTSISCDLHKYGFTTKGVSCVMYSNEELRRYQYFASPSWSGGIYASPTLAGSRNGAISVAAWACLMAMGRDGYLRCMERIMASRDVILSGIKAIAELKVLGDPQASVIAFASRDAGTLNIYSVGEAMSKAGWILNTLQNPSCLHICVTYMHGGPVAERFVSDLRDAVSSVLEDPSAYQGGSAAIYGMTASLPDVSIVDDLARTFIDTLFLA